ncbi:MAG: biopolymer transporter ExbD [Elusimicrobiota bacterium]
MIKVRRRNNEIPMSSMSDIAFLLIIFFIVTMSFVYKSGLNILLPKKGAQPRVVSVNEVFQLELNAVGRLSQNKINISLDSMKFGTRTGAIIKVDKACKYANVIALIEHLQKNGVYRISLKTL